MAAAILFPGDVVEEGMGPVRCSRVVDGRLCNGVLGWPRVGTELIERFDLEAGEYLGDCHPEVAGLQCLDCKAVAVFR